MTWIFGSFLVTPWALTSCYVVIIKQLRDQGTRYNRCVTGRRSRDENHAVRLDRGRESQSSKRHAANQRRL